MVKAKDSAPQSTRRTIPDYGAASTAMMSTPSPDSVEEELTTGGDPDNPNPELRESVEKTPAELHKQAAAARKQRTSRSKKVVELRQPDSTGDTKAKGFSTLRTDYIEVIRSFRKGRGIGVSGRWFLEAALTKFMEGDVVNTILSIRLEDLDKTETEEVPRGDFTIKIDAGIAEQLEELSDPDKWAKQCPEDPTPPAQVWIVENAITKFLDDRDPKEAVKNYRREQIEAGRKEREPAAASA